jgi:hypothetical protein
MSHLLKMFVLLLVIIGVVLGAYVLYEAKFSPEAKIAANQAEQTLQYEKEMRANEEAMRADTYGGKTPEGTLQLFADALKKGDINLAAKYFELDKQNEERDFLLKNRIVISKLGSDLERYNSTSSIAKEYYSFIYRNSDGSEGLQLDLRFSSISKLWKIESL